VLSCGLRAPNPSELPKPASGTEALSSTDVENEKFTEK